ncbi:RNA polymerase sigma factor [Pseudobacter ginsenosidimutans]|uniref:RNA polymerase sigma-70 factor (ECF subfamily) n=1 Tax=Pseudobacter ginsenosidimutans TaxID=661488 RepID=A0A4Q7MQQ7_9BACT|nr:RNA polymerase sigma-70 factor [Pseudobacter ginsenosidimutans]RZS71062.1 RNA polymerase sigma-70 factor (ECF subfamily) [Pseudobacter ginsenosidimutans]
MNTYDLHSDKELFSQIAEGDESAFATVFHKYNIQLFPGVLKVLKSQAEAEEIVQNTFLKLWLNRLQLPEIENPGAWLFRIASNLALNALRDKATYRHYTAAAGNSSPEGEPDALNEISTKELKSIIAEAVELMPTARQEVFRLSRYEGLSRQEIAQKLGIAESTVKNQLTSSLKFIQEFIGKKYGIHLPVIIFLLFK